MGMTMKIGSLYEGKVAYKQIVKVTDWSGQWTKYWEILIEWLISLNWITILKYLQQTINWILIFVSDT